MVFLPVDRVPAGRYLVAPSSFSEIENARAELDALGHQYLTEIRVRSRVYRTDAGLRSAATGASETLVPDDVVASLKRGIQEFEGTGTEEVLIQELLLALHGYGMADRWLDEFLTALYARPDRLWLGGLARRALLQGRATGRESEVIEAFEHTLAIPVGLPVKERLAEVLADRVRMARVAPAGEAVAL